METVKCKECGREVNYCENISCINDLHDSGSIKDGEDIFCEEEVHYCEKDCLVAEFRDVGINGVSTEVVKK